MSMGWASVHPIFVVVFNSVFPYTVYMMIDKEIEMNLAMTLTDAEFLALDRYSNGRLKDIADVFLGLSPAQIDQLHSDDWSYYQELQEELAYEMSFYE